jgi:WD40 repeat protein
MKALEPNVLQTALEIQHELLGPTEYFDPGRMSKTEVDLENFSNTDLTPDLRDALHAINGLHNSSWFFHSPLQYWQCSSQTIAEDTDILATVNRGSLQSTSVNVTLRHSIVFSGKRFEDHSLVAADALVITLVHKLDSPVGRQWARKAQDIADRDSNRWRLYPADGRSLASRLYEFRFQPLSFQDDLFLGLAYGFTFFYFLIAMSKLRALKSKLGLMLAITTQIAVSMLSSFTICAIFKIDLSKLPREAYPLVVLTVGLENIFRLVNAVIMTPSENPPASRIAEALGKTGYVALATVAQNLGVCWICYNAFSPIIGAFCIYAAIALTLDFFYTLTFFVSVLSIDVRRTELSDALSRAALRDQRLSTPETQKKPSWTEALLRGDAPVSTRVAGTIVMISFILAAQWHFFENENLYQTLRRIFRSFKAESQASQSSYADLLSVDVNQARTPTSWLRMQDHQTAQEVISVVKPNAHSYVAQVYDPLVFVLSGSDRTPTKFGIRPFLPAVYDFGKHQSTPFIISLVLILAGVTLLMNFLLWDELPEAEANDRPNDEPLLSVKTLKEGHALDVVLLKASSEGVVVSVGLDRWIRVWDVRNGGSHIIQDPESDINPFPILAMTIDSDSNWLALLSSKGLVALWNIPERRWGPTMKVEVKGAPAAFFFGSSQTEFIDPLIIVRHNGIMTELLMESKQTTELRICKTPLLCVNAHAEKPLPPSTVTPPLRIITSSRRGCVHVASKLETGWISEEVPCDINPSPQDEIKSVLALPALSSFLVVRTLAVELIDITTHKVTHTFHTKPITINSLRCFHSTRRRPQCGSVGLAYFTLAYTNAETGDCVMQAYLPGREGDTICFRDPWTPGSKTCCLWRETVVNTHVVENPGSWDALPVGYLIGVRKLEGSPTAPTPRKSTANSGLRRRGGHQSRSSSDAIHSGVEQEDVWEAWSLSLRGERSSITLSSGDNSELLVSKLGPIEKLGKRSLAVALGNVVKVVQVGSERFDLENDVALGGLGVASGRRKKAVKRNSHS